MAARGIDLEILETGTSHLGVMPVVLAPNTVKINGQEVLVPQDSTIEISPIDSNSVVTATITMMVRSLRIATEP
ncbi:hypothetical protein BN970_01352 [Mycolicibacterium conceptionense]|uniref:Uncharacterized protein n=1 Tax=Mycolicibacterium conceptionense TaxID=451644 RepID=A0A0U1D2Z7_9MYCO|nr:hypothetical protein [Mycolicibacterium conceptionense]ORV20952.1 hypothetical protein AWB98_01240 [Mycolicibacterium conceptionense]CQD07203.1 hypothetical protein BN970_01352 [Mycolicibacterium conceptionense]